MTRTMLKNVEKQEVFKKGKEAMVLVIYTKKKCGKSHFRGIERKRKMEQERTYKKK
jgi:hypothetical protein